MKGSDHCPAMKGIETPSRPAHGSGGRAGSDHCPAMKGIETVGGSPNPEKNGNGSDHCPAMKGIETSLSLRADHIHD